jgi:predicted DNA-binding transcriptional regulator AlpA
MTLAAKSQSSTPRHRDASLYGVGPDDKLVRLNEVMHLVGFGRTAIHMMIRRKVFPPPTKPGGAGSSRWPLGDIRKFNAAAVAARDRARSATPPD